MNAQANTSTNTTARKATRTEKVLAAYQQAEAEIGYINVAGRDHPDRTQCGEYPAVVAAMWRVLKNGQKIWNGKGRHSYRVLFPTALVRRADQLMGE